MASELTDKIRAKFPGQYDDLSDSDLEKAVLTKHPEYKDLTTKPTNISDSKTINADKSTPDNALDSPTRQLEASVSDSKARSGTDSIGASKSLSKGNLEANGATGQTNIIDPKEHESLLSKGWKLISEPLTDLPSRGARAISDAITTPHLNDNETLAKLKGFVGGSIEGVGNLASGTTSPISLATLGMGGIETSADKLGYEELANLMRTGMKVSGAPMIAHGASEMLNPDSSMEDRLKGLVEASGGAMPFFHGPTAHSSDLLESSKTELPDIADTLSHRPDLAAVGDEHLVNDSRTDVPQSNEDKLLNLVKERKGITEPSDSDILDKSRNLETPVTRVTDKGLPFASDKPETWVVKGHLDDDAAAKLLDMYKAGKGDIHRGYVKGVQGPALGEDEFGNQITPIDTNNLGYRSLDTDPLTPPTTAGVPQFNRRGQSGETGSTQNKPRLLLNADGTFINKETGETFDMRGHRVDESAHKPGSLIDSTDEMNNKEITHEGGSNDLPPDEEVNPNEPNEPRKTTFSDIINFPKAIKASWDLSAPGRQGLGLIHKKEWWQAWSDMFEGLKSDDAFKATQKAIDNRPLFKSYGDKPSFAQKSGLKLTNLGKLSDREESFMSSLAEKFPGVKPSERAYVAYLNKLRADTFENLLSKYKVLGEDGEYNIPLAKDLASYINNATGRGSLNAADYIDNKTVKNFLGNGANLESSAVALNNAFFSPRFLVSRLKLLGEGGKSVFTPSTYVFSHPSVRREYLKSLLAIAGVGTTIGELAKLGGATVEHDPTNSDAMKIKVGNTRIDPYAGMQQPIVLASRLLSGKSTSSVSGKETDLDNPKYGQSNRMDVIGRFARSKESPALSFAHGLLTGKDNAGNKFNVPEEIVQLFTPMILQDLKQVATENPNLIPYMHEEGLGFENTNPARGMLAIPGFFGAGVQNYGSKQP